MKLLLAFAIILSSCNQSEVSEPKSFKQFVNLAREYSCNGKVDEMFINLKKYGYKQYQFEVENNGVFPKELRKTLEEKHKSDEYLYGRISRHTQIEKDGVHIFFSRHIENSANGKLYLHNGKGYPVGICDEPFYKSKINLILNKDFVYCDDGASKIMTDLKDESEEFVDCEVIE